MNLTNDNSSYFHFNISEVDTYADLENLINTLETFSGNRSLGRLHSQHRKNIIEGLTKEVGFRKTIRIYVRNVLAYIAEPNHLKDPFIATNTCQAINLLLDNYVDLLPEHERAQAKDLLLSLLDSFTNFLLESAKGQIDILIRCLQKLLAWISNQKGIGRIVLVECPTGNSIPTQVLNTILSKRSHEPIILRVSLSRNDKAADGVTRKNIIRQKLDSLGIQSKDCIVYMDEWMTGTNFDKISKIISEYISKIHPETLFLPVGLLVNKARSDVNKYSEYCTKHDEILKKLNLNGTEFRFVFPDLISYCSKYTDRLFWSEYDRISGYRKLGFYGAIFSSLDAAINELAQNHDLLLSVIEEISNGSGASFRDLALHEFQVGLAEYRKAKSEIEMIRKSFTPTDICDPVKVIEEFLARFKEILPGKSAGVCLGLGVAILRSHGSVDPFERYQFDDEIPTICELIGLGRDWNQSIISKIMAAFDSAKVTYHQTK